MDVSQLGVVANGFAALALAALALSILVPLVRSGQLRRNRLDLAAAVVFLACAVGQAFRLAASLQDPAERTDAWPLAGWEAVTALVAVAYLRLRRVTRAPDEGGGLYEDALRRQHELAGQAMAANVREELATERAAAADQRFARVLAAAPVGMALVDRRGVVTRANPALNRILGRDHGPGGAEVDLRDGAPGPHLADVLAKDRQDVDALLARAADAGDGFELQIERPDGAVVWGRLRITPLADDDGSLLVQIEDATDRRHAEEQLEHLTLHDPLTSLPNRVLFSTRTAAALRQANRTGCYVGCLLMDLDHFKLVNDSLGHAAGDRLLTIMATRLAEVVRPDDTVARMGGDEFCLLLTGLEHQAEAEGVAQRVRAALTGIVDLDGTRVTTSASLGVAVARPGDKATPETLMRDADIALSRAKAEGRSRTVVFEAGLLDDVLRQLQADAEPASR